MPKQTVQRSNTGKHVARRPKLLRVEAGRGQLLFTGSSCLITYSGCTDSDSDRLNPRVTIGKLPDGVLLEIFVYVARRQVDGPRYFEDRWRTLVHVCKRWRSVVFSSPRRLGLQLFCTNTRPVKKLLDIWPPFPIHVFASHRTRKSPMRGVSNLVAALEQQNRVQEIQILGVPDSLLKKSVTMKPFPAPKSLILTSPYDEVGLALGPVLPDSFLAGSAPSLREIQLAGIPFPGLRKLLLSTTDLVSLYLHDIPYSRYISPEAMVVSLSMLTRLGTLELRFRFPRSRADREARYPSPITRVVLRTLTWLLYQGDSEYLEDIMPRIDAPLLDCMNITFFNQLLFDTPQLRHFISRTGIFRALDCARIFFDYGGVIVQPFRTLSLRILCEPSDWQLSSLSQLYYSALSPLPTLECLEICNRKYWEDDMENIQWLELLRLFATVKDLVLSKKSFRLVALALDEIDGEYVTEVLPALQNIIIRGPQPLVPDNKVIGKFIATRQLLGSPVTVQHLDGKNLDDFI
jgi:F-box-like